MSYMISSQSTSLQAHPIVLQKGMKKLRGFMFVGGEALYFICSSKGSALWDAVGTGVGGLVGGAIKAAGNKASKENTGTDSGIQTEADLRDAVEKNPGSIIFEPNKIEMIKNTIWMRMIRYDGQRIGLPTGYPKDLVQELAPWIQRHGVKSKGRAFQISN